MATYTGNYYENHFGEDPRAASVKTVVANDTAPGRGDGDMLDAVSQNALAEDVVDIGSYLRNFDWQDSVAASVLKTPAFVREGSGITFSTSGSGNAAGIIITAGAGAGPAFTSSVASPGPAFSFTVAADYKTASLCRWLDNGSGTPIQMADLALYDDTTNEWANLELSTDVAGTSTVSIALGRGFDTSGGAVTPGLRTPDKATPFGILIQPGAETGAAKGAAVTIQGGESGTGSTDGGDAILRGGPCKAATTGNSGDVLIETVAPGTNNTSGAVTIQTAAGNGTADSGTITVQTLAGGTTGDSGGHVYATGAGGATSGVSGGYAWTTGATTDGATGGYSWTSGNAAGTSRDSGGFGFTSGSATGTRGAFTTAVSTHTLTAYTAASAFLLDVNPAASGATIFAIRDNTGASAADRLQLVDTGGNDTTLTVVGATTRSLDLHDGTNPWADFTQTSSTTQLRALRAGNSLAISTANSAVAAGNMSLTVGNAGGSNQGGTFSVTAGNGGSSGVTTGGTISLTAGAGGSGGAGASGAISITSPAAGGGGTRGAFSVNALSSTFTSSIADGAFVLNIGPAATNADDMLELYENVDSSARLRFRLRDISGGSTALHLLGNNTSIAFRDLADSSSIAQIQSTASEFQFIALGQGDGVQISAGDGTTSTTGGYVNLTAGTGGPTDGIGGAVAINAGPSQGNATGGGVTIDAGAGGTTGAGGQTQIKGGAGGSSSGASGALLISTVTTTSGSAGDITIAGGNSGGGDGTGASIAIAAGNGNGTGVGGNLPLSAGDGGANAAGGNATITAGDGGSVTGNAGAIQLTSPSPAGSGIRGNLTTTSYDANVNADNDVLIDVSNHFEVRNASNVARLIVDDGGAIATSLAGTAALDASYAVFHTSNLAEVLRLETTSTGTNGPSLQLFHNDTGSDSDTIGKIIFQGLDSGDNEHELGSIRMVLDDAAPTSEDTSFHWWTTENATANEAMKLISTGVLAVDLAGSGTAAQVDLMDDYDDVALIRSVYKPQDPQATERGLQEWERLGLTSRKSDGRGWFLNLQPAIALGYGAIGQVFEQVKDLRAENAELRMRLERLEKAA